MNAGLRRALLLPLYPALFLAGPFQFTWFSASLAGWAAFVVALVTIQDAGFASLPFGAPTLAYLAGLVAAGIVLVIASTLPKRTEQVVRAPSISASSTLSLLEPIAREAARSALETQVAQLTDWDKSHAALGGHLSKKWAVFDWFILGRRPQDARVIVRACVNRETRAAIVEVQPPPTERPRRPIYLSIYTILAPLLMAAAFAGLFSVLDFWKFGGWPALGREIQYLTWTWPVCQLAVLFFLFQMFSSVPIKLPDGTLLFVNRPWLKRSELRRSQS